MRVCQGCVNEVQYTDKNKNKFITKEENKKLGKEEYKDGECQSFVMTKDTTFWVGEQTYIHDNIGYHKVSV